MFFQVVAVARAAAAGSVAPPGGVTLLIQTKDDASVAQVKKDLGQKESIHNLLMNDLATFGVQVTRSARACSFYFSQQLPIQQVY